MMSTLCTFFYFLCNNILWGVQSGILNKFITTSKADMWRRRRNTACFIKVILSIVQQTLSYRQHIRVEEKLYKELLQSRDYIIEDGDPVLETTQKLIDQRRMRRFEQIFTVQQVFRFLCLYKHLQMPYSQALHPIFISFCEFTSSAISVFKVFYHRPI